jgi:hypothetical protein
MHDYISGLANVMADDCSRLWHLTDTQLLAFFTLLTTGKGLDYVPPETQDAFHHDLRVAQNTARAAVSSKWCAAGQDTTWELWCNFCAKLNIDPLLEGAPDLIPYLMAFGQRVRDGHLAKSGKSVQHQTVEDTLATCPVGQTVTSMGASDK